MQKANIYSNGHADLADLADDINENVNENEKFTQKSQKSETNINKNKENTFHMLSTAYTTCRHHEFCCERTHTTFTLTTRKSILDLSAQEKKNREKSHADRADLADKVNENHNENDDA